MSYPEISLQSLAGAWWEPASAPEADRGRLLWAVLPHVDQRPFVLVTKGRTEATEHRRADYEVAPLTKDSHHPMPSLPVAGMPDLPDEMKMVLRAKRRPAVVLGRPGTEVERDLRRGEVKFHTNRTLLVAPYYSANKWSSRLVDKIRRCAYPQFAWDSLPLPGHKDSVLRLDHLQPLGCSPESFQLTPHRLTKDALALVDEQIQWLLKGTFLPGSILPEIRAELLNAPTS